MRAEVLQVTQLRLCIVHKEVAQEAGGLGGEGDGNVLVQGKCGVKGEEAPAAVEEGGEDGGGGEGGVVVG